MRHEEQDDRGHGLGLDLAHRRVVAGQAVAGEGGGRRHDPGRDGEPQDAADEPGLGPAVGGSERQEEGRDPDREAGDEGEVPGEERERLQRQPDGEGQHEGVDTLGEEEVGHPFDVVDHPSALADHVGHHREVVVEEDQARHRPARRRAGAHGHADVGVLERQDVVDPVAGHGHRVATGLEGVHHGPLLVRSDPPEHRAGVHDLGELVGVLGERSCVDRLVRAPSTSTARATAPTVRG